MGCSAHSFIILLLQLSQFWTLYIVLSLFKTHRFGGSVPETQTTSIYWAQVTRFHPETETESSFKNVVL
jgi:citrate lyase synthetase